MKQKSELSLNQIYNKCIEILRDYDSGKKLCSSDCNFVFLFAKRHPDADELFEDWSGDILVKNHPNYPNKCFWVVKNNGYLQHFSLKNCKAGKYPDSLENFRRACGTTIRDCLADLRKDCVERNNLDGVFQVHHAKIKLNDLIDEFIKQYKIDIKKVKFNTDPISFKDKELSNKWFEYHNKNATLQVVRIEHHKYIHSNEYKYFGSSK